MLLSTQLLRMRAEPQRRVRVNCIGPTLMELMQPQLLQFLPLLLCLLPPLLPLQGHPLLQLVGLLRQLKGFPLAVLRLFHGARLAVPPRRTWTSFSTECPQSSSLI